MGISNDLFIICAVTIWCLLKPWRRTKKKSNLKKEHWDSNSAYFNYGLNVKTRNRSTTPASTALAISQRYQIRIVRQLFYRSYIFKPGLLFSLLTWTRPTFDHSEVKIDFLLLLVLKFDGFYIKIARCDATNGILC